MRRNKLILIVMIAIILVLCAACKKTEQTAQEFSLEIRTDFLKAERLSAGAEITADYGDRVYEFTVKYTGNSQTGEISILAPEQVAGIKAEVTLPDCAIVYDGVRMETGALTGGGLTPVGAIPALINQWQSGYIESSVYEKLDVTETAAIATEFDESASQKTWFDVKTRLPVRSEIYEDGVMVIVCEFNNVVIE